MGNKKNIILDDIPIKINEIFNYSSKNNINILECSLNKIFEKKNILFVENGRTALSKSLKLVDLNINDEVIIPGYTCVAVKKAIEKVCTPKYVDINSFDFNINPDEIHKKITLKTKAIIVIHTYGKAADMSAIQDIAKENNLVLIEDLAQGIGGKCNSKNLGSFGDFTILSFSLHKDITSLSGGALISNYPIPKRYEAKSANQSLKIFYKLLIAKRNEFLRKRNKKYLIYNLKQYNERFLIKEQNKKIYDDMSEKNYITDYMAYLLNQQLKNLDKRIQQRRKNAKFYIEHLKSELTENQNFNDHTFYRFTIQVRDRQKIISNGLKQGIQFGKMYDYCLKSLPNSRKASETNLNIPVHWKLNEFDLRRVTNFINKNVK